VSVLSVEGLAEREAARAGRAGAREPGPAAAADAAKPKSRAHSISSRAGPVAGVQPAPMHAAAAAAGADPQTYAALLAAAEKVAAETPGAPRTPWAPGPAGGAFGDGGAGPGTPGGVEAVVVYPEAGERPRARPSRAGSEDCMSTARSQILELCQFLGVEDGAASGAPGAAAAPPAAGAAPAPAAAGAAAPGAPAAAGARGLGPPLQALRQAVRESPLGRRLAGGAAGAAGAAAGAGARGLALPFQPLTLAFRDICYTVELPKARGARARCFLFFVWREQRALGSVALALKP